MDESKCSVNDQMNNVHLGVHFGVQFTLYFKLLLFAAIVNQVLHCLSVKFVNIYIDFKNEIKNNKICVNLIQFGPEPWRCGKMYIVGV